MMRGDSVPQQDLRQRGDEIYPGSFKCQLGIQENETLEISQSVFRFSPLGFKKDNLGKVNHGR
jgi:hypothetical protein